jgi:hypothetical protein
MWKYYSDWPMFTNCKADQWTKTCSSGHVTKTCSSGHVTKTCSSGPKTAPNEPADVCLLVFEKASVVHSHADGW